MGEAVAVEQVVAKDQGMVLVVKAVGMGVMVVVVVEVVVEVGHRDIRNN